MNELIDINELSRMTGLSVSSLYKMTAKRQLPMLKIGRRVLFRRGDIDRWLECFELNPTPGTSTEINQDDDIVSRAYEVMV